MPFFQFQATDKQGNPVQGTVQAGTLDEANRALVLQGLQVTGLRDPNSVAPARPTPVQSAPPRVAAFERSPISAPAPVRVNVPTARPLGEPRKTKYSQDKDIHFIFSQLASYFKAGVNPAQAFTEVGNKQPRQDIKEAMLFVASRTGEGSGIADLLALYPFLFPPHVVGGVRAGEMGGYLPEAMGNISAQADASRKMRRLMIWLGWFTIGIPPAFPIGKALFNSVIASWDAQEKSGGTAPVASTVGKGFVHELAGPLGIYSLVILVLFIVSALAWQSMWFRTFRHKLALMIPTIGKRAKAEGFAAFTWNLSNLARAGIAPRQSFQLAAETVPSQEIRRALEQQWRQMTDQTKLSEALHNTKMLPYELGAMVQTGEVTGDVAGQLLNGARTQQQEFEHQDKNTKTRVGCWLLMLFFLVGPILVMYLYGNFLTDMIQKITGGE